MAGLTVLFVVVLLVSAVVAMFLARKRGYDGDLFAIGGFFAGPLAIFSALGAENYVIEDEPEVAPDPAAIGVSTQNQPYRRLAENAPAPQPVQAPGDTPWQQSAAPTGPPQVAPQPAPEPVSPPAPAPVVQPAPEPVSAPVPAPVAQPTPEPVSPPAQTLPPPPVGDPLNISPPQNSQQSAPAAAQTLAPPPLQTPGGDPLQMHGSVPESPQTAGGVENLVALISSEAPQANRYTQSQVQQADTPVEAKKGRFWKRKQQEENVPTGAVEVGFGVLSVPVPPGEATFGTCPHCNQESSADWYGLCVHCLDPFPVSVPYIDPNADSNPSSEGEESEDSKPAAAGAGKEKIGGLVAKLRQPIKIGK